MANNTIDLLLKTKADTSGISQIKSAVTSTNQELILMSDKAKSGAAGVEKMGDAGRNASGAFAVLATSFTLVGSAIGGPFGRVIATVGTRLSQFKSAFDAIKAICPGLVGGIQKVAGSIGMLGTTLAATGIGLVIAGITYVLHLMEESKKKLEEQKEAIKNAANEYSSFLDKVSGQYSTLLSNIDKETQSRKALITLLDRQTKAELELKRAKAESAGDKAGVEAMDQELQNLAKTSKMAIADAAVKGATDRLKEARDNVAGFERLEQDALTRRAKAIEAFNKKKAELSKPIAIGATNSMGMGGTMFMTPDAGEINKKMLETAEAVEVNAADEMYEAAKKKTREAAKAVRVEEEGLKRISKEREIIAAEIAAEEAKVQAKKDKATRDELAKKQEAIMAERAAEEKARHDAASTAKAQALNQLTIEEEAARIREEQREKEEAANKKRRETTEKILNLENQINAAKEKAAQWDKNAGAAQGQTFGEWSRGGRDGERAARDAGRKQRGMSSAISEYNRLRGMNPKAMTKGQIEKLGQLSEYFQYQDPENNPFKKDIEDKEAKVEKLRESMNSHLQNLDEAICGKVELKD